MGYIFSSGNTATTF